MYVIIIMQWLTIIPSQLRTISSQKKNLKNQGPFFMLTTVCTWHFLVGKKRLSNLDHQTVQVPHLEAMYLKKQLFSGVGTPENISRIHTAFVGEDSSILGT